MPIAAAAIMGGTSLLGGYMAGKSAEKAGEASARGNIEAARIAAEAAKFRPVGITTRFGSSNFQFDPSGYVSGAGYTVSPELRAYQDRLMGLTERGLGQAEAGEAMLRPTVGAAESLFNLGSRYLDQTPEQTAQKYMESQYNLLAPSRERQYAQLQNQLFQSGRGGLSVGGTGLRPGGGLGLSASQPELESYYNAIAQQDLELAQRAEQAGRERTAFGAGLFGTGSDIYNLYSAGQVNALSPFTSYLGAGSTIEQLGQQPFEMSSTLGGRAATAGGNVGQFLLSGGQAAARARQDSASSGIGLGLMNLARSPEFGTGVANWWQQQGFGGGSPTTAAGYNISPNVWEGYLGTTPSANLTRSPFGT
jgi:hypothetical protein